VGIFAATDANLSSLAGPLATFNCLFHAVGGCRCVFVFPDYDHEIPGGTQLVFRLFVTYGIRAQLFIPPLRVQCATSAVIRTVMPKAAANVHRDSGARKADIDCLSSVRQQPLLQAVSQSSSVKLSTEIDLRCGVASPLQLHRPTSSRLGGRRWIIVLRDRHSSSVIRLW
jgi:hypothetical protein